MYVNIDDCWTVKPGSTDPVLGGPPRDAQGNINPNRRFPDMKALADYIHAKGLKAGIYTWPGRADLCAARRAATGTRSRTPGSSPSGDSISSSTIRAPTSNVAADGRDSPTASTATSSATSCPRRRHERHGQVGPRGGRPQLAHRRRSGRRLGLRRGATCFGLYGRNELQSYSGPGGWNDPDYLCWATLAASAKTSAFAQRAIQLRLALVPGRPRR